MFISSLDFKFAALEFFQSTRTLEFILKLHNLYLSQQIMQRGSLKIAICLDSCFQFRCCSAVKLGDTVVQLDLNQD